jgi:lipase maturation factor
VEWFTAEDYTLARLVFQRALGVIYLVAFLVALNQFRALLGDRGLLPIRSYLRGVSFRRAPSIFHWHYSDRFFALVAATGAVLAAATVLGVTDVVPLPLAMLVWLVLWVLYLSIVNVGQRWYGFGWESLLLECGFIAVFLGNSSVAPPLPVLIALRWLLFRLEFGAGLIKMRGDSCWRDLTCLYYHHETQPMPGPFSWYFHRLPRPLHRVEVAANHVTQLVIPFGLFLPQPVAGICAVVMVATQLWLVISGNFAWLNWLAIVLALPVVPDRWWQTLLPFLSTDRHPDAPLWWVVTGCALAALVLVLSRHPVRNMLSRSQAMNASFNAWHLINTYGAFGSVNQVRFEIVIEGTDDPSGETGWQEYEFRGKPGDPHRRPRQFAPYHLRLDWLMWFAALSPAYGQSWFPRLMGQLLEGDRDTVRLLRHNPFPDAPPAALRARFYRYRYTTWEERRRDGAWWHREPAGEFMRPVTLADLR